MPLLDLSQTETATIRELLSDGFYTFIVEESKLKHTRAGDGQYIAVTFSCRDEKFLNRKVWAHFNIVNKNQKAEQIGKSQLKSLLKCAGKSGESLASVDELLGLRMKVKIATEHKPPFDAKNVVKGFMAEKKAEDVSF